MKVANGRLRGKQPRLKPNQAKHLLELHDLGTYTQAELAELLASDGPSATAASSGCGPRPPQPERPFATLRIRRRRAEPDIPIKQSEGSAQPIQGRLASPYETRSTVVEPEKQQGISVVGAAYGPRPGLSRFYECAARSTARQGPSDAWAKAGCGPLMMVMRVDWRRTTASSLM